MAEKRTIPLQTKYHYEVDSDGRVFRDGAELKGWTHYHPQYGGPYRRHRLIMEGGARKLVYAHRLVALVFLDLDLYSDDIVRHLNDIGTDNQLSNLKVGTHKENQTEDRKRNGTYHKRGAQQKQDDENDVPF